MPDETGTTIYLDDLLCACRAVAIGAADAIARSDRRVGDAKVVSVVRRDATLTLGTRVLSARLANALVMYDPGHDPLIATLSLARECDQHRAFDFERVGPARTLPIAA